MLASVRYPPELKLDSDGSFRAGGLLVLAALLILSLLHMRGGQVALSRGETPTTMGSGGVPAPRLAPFVLETAEAEVRGALAERTFPGAALAVGVGPKVDRLVGVGKVGWGSAAPPVSPDSTLYDLASLTKAVWVVLLSNRTYDVRNRAAAERIGQGRTEVWEAVKGSGVHSESP